MLILPEITIATASECAERLRRAVQTMQIQLYGQTIEGIRLSIGLASYPEHGGTVEAVVRAADRALYRAKENGRDQLMTAEAS